jgi:hypothetical protein
MAKRREHETLLHLSKITSHTDQHLYEVKRRANGFVIVTRHYSLGSAEIEARLNGGEVTKR